MTDANPPPPDAPPADVRRDGAPNADGPPRFGWPRRMRLRKRRDFAQIQRSGARAANNEMVVLCRKTRAKDAPGRVGFAVSKKVGDAPTRNLIKRRLRHLARTQKPLWDDLDVVILVRPDAARASFATLSAAFADAHQRARRALARPKSNQRGGRRGGKPPPAKTTQAKAASGASGKKPKPRT